MANSSLGSVEQSIASGNFYDAQQMVKMISRRMCAKGKVSEAADFCVESAKRLAACSQYELVAALGSDIVETYEATSAATSEDNISRVEVLVASIPPQLATVEKYRMLNKALAWSAKCTPHGHPRLHWIAAQSYRAEENFGRCQAHLVFCGDGPGLAEMVKEWRSKGYPNEKHLFSLRTLLMLLSLGDVMTARTFWLAVEGEQGAVSSTCHPIPEPPVQCGAFLLAAAEGKSLEFFRVVRAKYALVIRRDVSFDLLLDEIEASVFNERTKKSGLGGLLESLLQGMS